MASALVFFENERVHEILALEHEAYLGQQQGNL